MVTEDLYESMFGEEKGQASDGGPNSDLGRTEAAEDGDHSSLSSSGITSNSLVLLPVALHNMKKPVGQRVAVFKKAQKDDDKDLSEGLVATASSSGSLLERPQEVPEARKNFHVIVVNPFREGFLPHIKLTTAKPDAEERGSSGAEYGGSDPWDDSWNYEGEEEWQDGPGEDPDHSSGDHPLSDLTDVSGGAATGSVSALTDVMTEPNKDEAENVRSSTAAMRSGSVAVEESTASKAGTTESTSEPPKAISMMEAGPGNDQLNEDEKNRESTFNFASVIKQIFSEKANQQGSLQLPHHQDSSPDLPSHQDSSSKLFSDQESSDLDTQQDSSIMSSNQDSSSLLKKDAIPSKQNITTYDDGFNREPQPASSVPVQPLRSGGLSRKNNTLLEQSIRTVFSEHSRRAFLPKFEKSTEPPTSLTGKVFLFCFKTVTGFFSV
jgi:hypothetical protein